MVSFSEFEDIGRQVVVSKGIPFFFFFLDQKTLGLKMVIPKLSFDHL